MGCRGATRPLVLLRVKSLAAALRINCSLCKLWWLMAKWSALQKWTLGEIKAWMTFSKSGQDGNEWVLDTCWSWGKQDCMTLDTCESKKVQDYERLWASLQTFFDRRPRLEKRSIVLLILGEERVTRISSVTSAPNCIFSYSKVYTRLKEGTWNRWRPRCEANSTVKHGLAVSEAIGAEREQTRNKNPKITQSV